MTVPRGGALLLGLAMVAAGIGSGRATAADAPGDATRGQAVFTAKRCVRCHAVRGQPSVGPVVEELRRLQGAYELAGRFWNHAPAMFTALRRDGIAWPEIEPAEMADLMAYLQADASRDPPPDPFQGHILLVSKGCLKCHRYQGEGGKISEELTQYNPGYQSPVAWAGAVWKHAPRMAEEARRIGVSYPRFTGVEMGNLVGLLRSTAKSP
jgi:mono/diheme cytochrome c family protein